MLALVLCWLKLNAQEPLAILKKNVNSRADSLEHFLSATHDTLVLQSSKKIDYVYSINRNYEREVNDYIFDTQYRVPLGHLSSGKHVFVVGHSKMKIVFVVIIREPTHEHQEANDVLLSSRNN